MFICDVDNCIEDFIPLISCQRILSSEFRAYSFNVFSLQNILILQNCDAGIA